MPLAFGDVHAHTRAAGDHVDDLRHLPVIGTEDFPQVPAEADHRLGGGRVPMDGQHRPGLERIQHPLRQVLRRIPKVQIHPEPRRLLRPRGQFVKYFRVDDHSLFSALRQAQGPNLVRDVRDADDVGEDAGGGDGGAGTVALDEHRVVVVAFGGEEDDVVGTVQGVEGMVLVEGAQRNRVLAIVHLGDEAPVLVLLLQLAALLLKGRVQGGKLLPELVQRALEELLRDERLGLHVLLIDLVAGLAGEDDQLADDVRAGQVHARVGLGIALFLGHPDGLAEGDVGRDGVEDEVQRAAQDGLDPQDVVAAVAEAVDGVDDGQARAHIGLEEELDTAAAGRLLEFAVVLVVRRGGDLVGRDHGDAVLEEVLVQGGDLGARGAIDKDRVEDVHPDDLVAQAGRRDRYAAGQSLLPGAQVDAAAVEHGLGAAGDAHHIDFQVPAPLELVLLQGDLLDQLPADRAHAADEQVQLLVLRQEESLVHHIQGLPQVAVLHDEGDVRLGGALGAGDDADAVAAQDAEQLARDAAVVLHVLAHDGDRGQPVLPLHGIDGTALDLHRERLGQHPDGLGGIRRADADGDARLGGRLAHEEHVDALLGQGRENALVHADDTYHRRRGKGDERNVVDGRDALDHPLVLLAGDGLADQGSRRLRVEGVLHEDGNPLQAHRIQGGRIHHLGAEVTELRGLLVGEFVDDVGVLDDPGIGRHEAVDIGPNLQRGGVQGGGEDAGRVVRPAAAQRGDLARLVPRDEARHDGHRAVFPVAGELLGDQPVRLPEVHQAVLRPDEIQRIVLLGIAHGGRHDERRQPLAEAQDLVPRLLRQHLQQEHAAADAVQFVEQGVHGEPQQLPALAGVHERIARVGVPLPQRLQLLQIGRIGRLRQRGDPDELVRDPAQRGHDDDHHILLGLYDRFDLLDALGRGDGTAAEFQDLHNWGVCLFLLTNFSRLQIYKKSRRCIYCFVVSLQQWRNSPHTIAIATSCRASTTAPGRWRNPSSSRGNLRPTDSSARCAPRTARGCTGTRPRRSSPPASGCKRPSTKPESGWN